MTVIRTILFSWLFAGLLLASLGCKNTSTNSVAPAPPVKTSPNAQPQDAPPVPGMASPDGQTQPATQPDQPSMPDKPNLPDISGPTNVPKQLPPGVEPPSGN